MSQSPEPGEEWGDWPGDGPKPDDRCQICGDFHAPDDEPRPRNVENREVGDLGQGTIPLQCCQWWHRLLEAPLSGDGCMICGAADAKFYLEIEGQVGVDEIDAHYSGTLCADCSKAQIFGLQEAASEPIEDDQANVEGES